MKRNILLLILLSAQTLVAQTPCGTTTDGKPLPRPSASTIDSLVKAKAYANAYALLQQEYTCAKAEGRSYDLLRAACGIAMVGKQLPVNTNAEALLRHTLPHLAPPEKALCNSLLAELASLRILRRWFYIFVPIKPVSSMERISASMEV